jgi:hypothetical protein
MPMGRTSALRGSSSSGLSEPVRRSRARRATRSSSSGRARRLLGVGRRPTVVLALDFSPECLAQLRSGTRSPYDTFVQAGFRPTGAEFLFERMLPKPRRRRAPPTQGDPVRYGLLAYRRTSRFGWEMPSSERSSAELVRTCAGGTRWRRRHPYRSCRCSPRARPLRSLRREASSQ